jgi:hypothetical protein
MHVFSSCSLFLLHKMRSQNIEGLQGHHNFHHRLSIIPRLLYVTGGKISVANQRKSLIDKVYSCRDLLLMNAICQTLRVTASSVVD